MIVTSLATSWREIWVVWPTGMQVAPGQSEAWKLPSRLLAELGVQTGWDWFIPCKAEPLHRNVAFGLGPMGLVFHHCCLLAGQKGCHPLSVSTSVIV